MDIILSVFMLVIASPLILIFSVLIKLESKGPCFYYQERVGKDGRCFSIYKLRSMKVDAETAGPQWAQIEDSRITRVGKFIRRYKIDEIPQFYNVIKGNMSIIGPRPERPYFVIEFSKEIPGFVDRLKVKPGLTGWAQVNGGYGLTPKEKLEKDLYYINKQSFWLDIKIIIKTVAIVLASRETR